MEGKHVWASLGLVLVLAGGQPGWARAQASATDEAEATATETATDKARSGQGTHQMTDVVVTATRTEVEADKAPASVSIITREEMERQNMRTADDALRYEAGVYTRRGRGVQDPAASSTVSMRGLAQAKRTLILVDGIPFNDGYSSGVTWSSIPVDSIERIEVIRGPGSARAWRTRPPCTPATKGKRPRAIRPRPWSNPPPPPARAFFPAVIPPEAPAARRAGSSAIPATIPVSAKPPMRLSPTT